MEVVGPAGGVGVVGVLAAPLPPQPVALNPTPASSTTSIGALHIRRRFAGSQKNSRAKVSPLPAIHPLRWLVLLLADDEEAAGTVICVLMVTVVVACVPVVESAKLLEDSVQVSDGDEGVQV